MSTQSIDPRAYDDAQIGLRRRTAWAEDFDTAVAVMTDTYGEVTNVGRPALGIHLRLELVTLPLIRLGELKLSQSVWRGAHNPMYAVCLPTRGCGRITSQTGWLRRRVVAARADHARVPQ
jgi:hypothetical protein